MVSVKEINNKNRTYYYFDDMNNIKDLDSNLLKIDKKSDKNVDVYYIGYIIMKDFDYVKINSVNLLYLIIDKVDWWIEGKSGNKYLALVSTDKIKEVLIKYTELRDKIKNLIKNTNGGKAGEYEKDFMKIKFISDDNLPLNKTWKLHNMIIVIRSVFQEHDKYCASFFWTNVCMSYKC